MRVLIIGVGGVGAMAAWRLALAGQEVVAFEQFGIDHDRGSSYGDSRIVRRVYPDALYTNLMADAYELWDELQVQSPDEELFLRAGGVFVGPRQHPLIQQAQDALRASGVDYEVLDRAECSRRFPAFVLNEDEAAVYEPSMGYARASNCVRAAVRLAKQHGAAFWENTPIERIVSDNNGVRISTAAGQTIYGDRLLLTAGPWTGPKLTELGVQLSFRKKAARISNTPRATPIPLKVTRQTYIHLRPAQQAERFGVGAFPVWIDADTNFYGFPQMGNIPGVKIGLHDRGVITTPETVSREVTDADIASTLQYAAQRFPWLGREVAYSKVCLYTNTPDEDFILDAVPGLPHTFVVGGLSGHGFKFTPLLGQILADLAQDKPVSYDLSRFRLARFAPV